MSNALAKLGNNIKEIRKDHRMTLKDVSSKCNIASSYISDIENSRKVPSLQTLDSLAEALNVDIVDFFVESQVRGDGFYIALNILRNIDVGAARRNVKTISELKKVLDEYKKRYKDNYLYTNFHEFNILEYNKYEKNPDFIFYSNLVDLLCDFYYNFSVLINSIPSP